jgi:putative ABC transport system ATP-binding protein
VIAITHEHDIAQFAGRVVAFRDGRIVSDQPVEDRRIARPTVGVRSQESAA